MTDFDAILNDDSINCVVELMGGVTAAKDVSTDAPRWMSWRLFIRLPPYEMKTLGALLRLCGQFLLCRRPW